jgi:hypothetical protein
MKCLRPRLRKRERHVRSSRVRGKQFELEAVCCPYIRLPKLLRAEESNF